MVILYQLRRDKEHIERCQHATLTTENFGIEPTHGLYGSEEWWQNIATGRLSIITLRGIITKIYMGSMNDWPEFKMKSDSGEETSWTRFSNSKEQYALYEVGRHVEIDYVLQHHRPKCWDHGAETKCVLEIRIGDRAQQFTGTNRA